MSDRGPAGARRFGALTRDAMNESQRAVNDELVAFLRPDRAGTGESIGGPMDALLHSPSVASATGRMVVTMFRELGLPRDVVELAILLTARHWDCDYEFHVHRRYAGESGLDLRIVDAIERGEAPKLSPEMTAVRSFVLDLLRDGAVGDEVFDGVATRWGRRGAVELIAAVGFYTTLAFVMNVDRLPVERDGVPWSLPEIRDR